MNLADLFVSIRADDRQAAKAIDRTGKNLRGVETQAGKATASVSRFGSVTGSLGSGLSRLGGMLGVVGKGIVGLGVGAAGAAASVAALAVAQTKLSAKGRDITDSFIDVQRVSGMTREQMIAFRNSMVQIAKANKGLSVEKLAEIALEGAKLGVPASRLEDYATKLGKASIAMDELGAGELAASMGAVNQQFKLSTEDSDKLASAIAKMSSSTAASAGTLFDFLGRTGAVAHSLGLSVDQAMGYGAALLDLKMTSAQAASGFNALAQATSDANNIANFAKLFRMSPAAVDQAMKSNQDLLMKKFLQVVGSLEKAGAGGSGQLLEAFGVSSQESVAAILAMAGAVGKVSELQTAANRELASRAALTNAVNINASKSTSIWTMFTNAMTGASVALSDMLAPGFDATTGSLASLANSVESAIRTMTPAFQSIASVVGQVFGFIQERFISLSALYQQQLAPTFTELSLVVGGAMESVRSAFDSVLPHLQRFQNAFAVWHANVIGTMVSLVKGVRDAIINWDISLRMGVVYFQMAASAIAQIVAQIPGVVASFGSWFIENWSNIFIDAFNAVTTIGKNFLDNITTLFGMIRDVLSDPVNAEIDASKLNIFRDLSKGMDEFQTKPLRLPGFEVDVSEQQAMIARLSKQMADRTATRFVETVTDEGETEAEEIKREIVQEAKDAEKEADKPKPSQRRGGMAGAVNVEGRGVQDLLSFTKGIADAALKEQNMKTSIDLQRTGNSLLQTIAQNTAAQPGTV